MNYVCQPSKQFVFRRSEGSYGHPHTCGRPCIRLRKDGFCPAGRACERSAVHLRSRTRGCYMLVSALNIKVSLQSSLPRPPKYLKKSPQHPKARPYGLWVLWGSKLEFQNCIGSFSRKASWSMVQILLGLRGRLRNLRTDGYKGLAVVVTSQLALFGLTAALPTVGKRTFCSRS